MLVRGDTEGPQREEAGMGLHKRRQRSTLWVYSLLGGSRCVTANACFGRPGYWGWGFFPWFWPAVRPRMTRRGGGSSMRTRGETRPSVGTGWPVTDLELEIAGRSVTARRWVTLGPRRAGPGVTVGRTGGALTRGSSWATAVPIRTAMTRRVTGVRPVRLPRLKTAWAPAPVAAGRISVRATARWCAANTPMAGVRRAGPATGVRRVALLRTTCVRRRASPTATARTPRSLTATS